MILRLALRSLSTRPVRTLILACGFGLGIGIMAILLGVGEVILDQARSPALQGGGEMVVSGAFGALDNARFVLSSVLGLGDVRSRVSVASPFKRTTVFLVTPTKSWPVIAHGGVPSLERAVGDPEVANTPGWVDIASDARWASPDPADVLRTMDRFHVQPTVPEFASSWAEWLYFNGRTIDGRTRLYLTFLGGPTTEGGRRVMGVRLQLERDGRTVNYSSSAEVDAEAVLARAPDLDVGENHVHLDKLRYEITLRLEAEGAPGTWIAGTLSLDGVPGRSLPPTVIHGARGWESGYVVPVLSGRMRGVLMVDRTSVPLDNMTGYHDHNWGFWQDVHWQWGQVAHDDLSFVWGRVFPPASVADPERIPGFLGVLGPSGPLGVSTDVSIRERDVEGQPQEVTVVARGKDLDLRLGFAVDRALRTERGPAKSSTGQPLAFLQLAGAYTATGQVGGRTIDFTSRGAAETFRPR
jgi:hypothetical protein